MPNVSIAVSARDNFSTSIKSMSQVTRGFSKDAEDMQKKLDMLNKTKGVVKVDVDAARKELTALEKQYASTRSEADRLNLEMGSVKYENAKSSFNAITKGAKEAEKAIVSIGTANSKLVNRAFSKNNFTEMLVTAGAIKMGSDMLSGISQTMVGSAFGSEASSMFSNMISSAGTGAAIGTAIGGPGIGTAIGGGIGLAVGAINGEAQNFQKRDDAFKGVVQSEYERLQQDNSSTVMSGIDIAASREMDKIAFGKLYGNDLVGAAQLDWAIETANETPFLYEDLKGIMKTLATYNYGSKDTREAAIQIGDTGAALGMNAQGMSMLATGLGRMKSTDKANLEYMNLLTERGVNAQRYLAEHYSKTEAEIYSMISKGEISGKDAAQIIADSMGKEYAGSMEAMSKTFTGLSSTLKGWEQEFQNAAGAGYLEIRTPAQEKQVEHYDMMGNKYKEAAGVSGKLMAVQENKQARILKEQMTGLFDSTEYKEALENINKAETELLNAEASGNSTSIEKAEDKLAAALVETQRLIDKTEGNAEALFKGTDMVKAVEQSNADLLTSLRGFLKEGDTWKAWGYNTGIEMGKGMMSVQPENAMLPTKISSTHSDAWGMDYSSPKDDSQSSTPLSTHSSAWGMDYSSPKDDSQPSTPLSTHGSAWGMDYLPPKKAFGMDYVPYDNFPALLHQGERVLTASEARSATTSTPSVTVTGNSFTVREEADIDKIAAALAQQLAKARATYAP